MIDDAFVLKAERLRDDVEFLRRAIRSRYSKKTSQVSSAEFIDRARELAEAWMVELATQPELRSIISPEIYADLGIHFQRLLTISEHRSVRAKYDEALGAILDDFRAKVIIPLKQYRSVAASEVDVLVDTGGTGRPAAFSRGSRVFVGHSFESEDRRVVDAVVRLLTLVGLVVVTGERPKAERISDKIKARIESSDAAISVFTRRDKISGKDEWTTSAWLIDEKAYALAMGRRLILLRERGVSSIGGLHGDYEYIEFERGRLELLILSLMELLSSDE